VRAAGLLKVRLLEEPVAAALAYGVGVEQGDELVMVYDLGGGTLDVSVLRVGGGTAEVLASAGDPWCAACPAAKAPPMHGSSSAGRI
jgi:molecular chaperone DnaK